MTDPAPIAVCPVCGAERPARTFWWFQPRDHLMPGVACDECYRWANGTKMMGELAVNPKR